MKAPYLLALALASPVALATHFSPFEGRFDCPGIGNSLICARTIEKSLGASYLHRIADGRLDVDLLDGRVHSFVDRHPGEVADNELYSALEVDLLGRYVVIHRQRYEGSLFGLLDRKTGLFAELGGYPVFSPDRRWIAVADSDAGSATLQIYRVGDTELAKAYDGNPGNRGVADVVWISSAALGYRHVAWHDAERREVKSSELIARFDGKAWQQ